MNGAVRVIRMLAVLGVTEMLRGIREEERGREEVQQALYSVFYK